MVIDSGGPVVDASTPDDAAVEVASVGLAAVGEGSAAVAGGDGSPPGRVLDVTGWATGVIAPAFTCGADVGGAVMTGGAVLVGTVAGTVGPDVGGGATVVTGGGLVVVVGRRVVVVVVLGGRFVVVVVERRVVVVVVGLVRADAMGIPTMSTIAIVAHETSPAINNSTLRRCLFNPGPNRRTASFYPTGRLVHQSPRENWRIAQLWPPSVTITPPDASSDVH